METIFEDKKLGIKVNIMDEESQEDKEDYLESNLCFLYNDKDVVIKKKLGVKWLLSSDLRCLDDPKQFNQIEKIIREQLVMGLNKTSIKEILNEIKERTKEWKQSI